MLDFMRSIEIHLLTTARDEEAVVNSGLVEPRALDYVECCACGEEAGMLDGSFVPYAVLLDEADVPWIACYDCLADVIDPVADVSLAGNLFVVDDPEDYEGFDLFDK